MSTPNNMAKATMAMHCAVRRLKGRPYARLLSHSDLIKPSHCRITYEDHWKIQPPQPAIHTIDFCEPQLLKRPDVISSKPIEMFFDDECSLMSNSTTMVDEDASLDGSTSASPILSSPWTPRGMDGIEKSTMSFQELTARNEKNFWSRPGSNFDWQSANGEQHCSGSIMLPNTLRTNVAATMPKFLVHTIGAHEAVRPMMTDTNAQSMTIELWQNCNLALPSRNSSHMESTYRFEMLLYQEMSPSASATHLPVAMYSVSAHDEWIQEFAAPSTETSGQTNYFLSCEAKVTPARFVDAIWQYSQKSLDLCDYPGLTILEPRQTLLANRFLQPSGRFFLRGYFKYPSSSVHICLPWVSDPFYYCPSGGYSLPNMFVSFKDCWMMRFSNFVDAFFAQVSMEPNKNNGASQSSDTKQPARHIPFNTLYNFLQYLLIVMKPKSFAHYAVSPKHFWQFMLECNLVAPEYHALIKGETRKTSHQGTISFGDNYTTEHSNHLQFGKQTCESMSLCLNNRLCRVDLPTCHRALYPIAQMLFRLNEEAANHTLLNMVWSSGFVALGPPPMINLLDCSGKFWFSLEPCKPFHIDINVSGEQQSPSFREKCLIDWTDSVPMPESTNVYGLYMDDVQTNSETTISLWCAEIGTVVVSDTRDEHLSQLLRDLDLSSFYGTDNATNLLKRSLVANLLY